MRQQTFIISWKHACWEIRAKCGGFSVMRSFSQLVWFDFRCLIGSQRAWRLESGRRKQRNWSQVLAVYVRPPWALPVKEDDEITTRPEIIRTHMTSGLEWTRVLKMESAHHPHKPRSAPEHIIFQTSDDPVELRFGSSGVRGTESSQPRPQSLYNWSDVSLNRDKPEWICLRSQLWTQPLTKWVFSTHSLTHTLTHAHTHTHPPVLPEHLGTWTNTHHKHTASHLWHKKPEKQQHEARPVWRGLLSVTQQPLWWWARTTYSRPDTLTSGEETQRVPVVTL